MNNINKLFRVDLGDPDSGRGFISFGGDNSMFFVVANDYNEAANKVIQYLQSVEKAKRIIDADGSLIQHNLTSEIKIKSINLVTNELIF